VQQLSIIVPLLGQPSSFEETLISVLENRPRGAEVIVSCDENYSDPYALEGEVEFIRLQSSCNWIEHANAAAQRSRGDAIHWLWPGAHVEEGWTDAAVEALQFDDELGSVAPIVVIDEGLWAGVQYCSPGQRVLQRCDRSRQTGQHRLQIDGPSLLAGWYQRHALFEMGGWDAEMGPAMADIDLALRLKKQGYRCQLAVTSQINFPGEFAELPAPRGYEFGKSATRMLQRHGDQFSDDRGVLTGVGTAIHDLFRATPVLGAASIWSGRLAAKLSRDTIQSPWTDHRRDTEAETHRASPDSKSNPSPASQDGEWQDDNYRRIDTSHSHAPARKQRAMRREFECG
jgi:hypothetical protein